MDDQDIQKNEYDGEPIFDGNQIGSQFALALKKFISKIIGGMVAGVTSIIAGSNINVSGAVGNVTVSSLVTDATLPTSDITTNDVSTSKHGFTPKLPNDATKFLDGTGAYSVPTGGGAHAEGWTLSVTTGTGDTSGSHVLAFAPVMVLITYRHTSNDMGAFGIWITGTTNQAGMPGGGLGSIAGGGWLGISTGTPGTYVVSPSLSGTTLSYHYANSAAGTAVFDFWAIG